MSKFLKLKQNNGQRVLVRADAINAVFETEEGSVVELADAQIEVKEGYQTVVNRLTKGDAADE